MAVSARWRPKPGSSKGRSQHDLLGCGICRVCGKRFAFTADTWKTLRISHRSHNHDDDGLFLVSTETGQVRTNSSHSRTEKPQITQIDADGPRGFNAWRGLPAVVERRPGTAGPTHRSGRKHLSRWPGPAACALGERRPRHCSILRLEVMCPPSKYERGQAEPTRRKRGVRETARRRRTLASGVDVLSPGGRRSPDRRLFRRQSSPLPLTRSLRLSAPICVICGFFALVAFVSLCLRVCDVASGRLCVYLMPKFSRRSRGSLLR